MTRLLLSWLLAGVFLASLVLNMIHWTGLGVDPEPGPAGGPTARCIDFEELELTSDQEAAVTRCCMAFGDEEGALKQELASKRTALEAALVQEQLDEESLRRLAAEVCALRTQLLKGRIESVIEVRTILNPCQMRQIRGCCKSCPKSEFASEVE